jgi:hypothetical protein
MAARTPSTVEQHSAGNLTLSIINFTDLDQADTYDSYIESVVGYWANATDDPTQNLERIMVKYTKDASGVDEIGTFTFYPEESNRVVQLFVLSRT